ncbi:MAG: hypothetical protein VX460_04055 [Planctomycetota bacterium]|nr:hypothetical protein [Planctomycetota bacterium]
MIVPADSLPGDGPDDASKAGAGAPARRPRASAPKVQDLAGLRVLLEGRGALGPLLRSLGALRDLAEHGADVIVVDHGLGDASLGELRRRAPFARFVPAPSTATLVAPLGAAPPPRFLLVSVPGIAVGRREARELMATLGRAAPGAAIAPALRGPDRAALEPPGGDGGPHVGMARRNEVAAGVSLRMREHRGARALVERPAELASLTEEVHGR